MAQRLLTSAHRGSARFAFVFTLSLSCTYLCYNMVFYGGAVMTEQGYEGIKRCPPSRSAGGKKLLGKVSDSDCASPDVGRSAGRSAANEQRSKEAPGAHWDRGSPRNTSVAQKSGNKKLPNALLVGVKKGGTRAVLEFIRIHPDVRALGTEPHFFDRNYDRGLDWYR